MFSSESSTVAHTNIAFYQDKKLRIVIINKECVFLASLHAMECIWIVYVGLVQCVLKCLSFMLKIKLC